MNNKLKKGLTTTMAAAMGLGVVIPAVPVIAAPATNSWVNTSAGWTYYQAGKKVSNGWVKDNGTWYYIDANGIMATGWRSVGGVWYFMDDNGAMATGWKSIGGKWYFMASNGAMQKGWYQVGPAWYFSNPNGDMVANQWVGNYYLGASGAMLANTLTPDNYFVDANGAWDGKAKYDLAAIETAVAKAEVSKLQADVDAAKALVDALPDVKEKDAFTKRLSAINANLQVSSVNAINATQLLVTFNKEVDKTDAENSANYKIGSLAVTPVLQADKKSVILTTNSKISGTNLYIVNPIKSATDATVKTPIFTFVETYTDTVAPVVSNVTYPTYDKATVNFSEPISALGNVTITQDGAPIVSGVTNDFVSGTPAKAVTFDLTNAAADKPITVVIVGAKDTGDNLINPNPISLTFTKSKTDTAKPTVSAVNVLSDTRVSITFSEKLKAAPTVKVGTEAVTFAADATTDNITWTGTFVSIKDVQPVAISAFTDMSANDGDAITFVKQVTADTTKPVLSSSEVKVFNNKPYLVLHYSEDVTSVGGVLTGTRVKDYVSNSFTTTSAVTPVAYTKANGADADDTKSVMLDISDDTTFPVGTYTVSVPAGFVQDKASTLNNNDAATIRFTKGTVTVNDTTAPTVNAKPTVSKDNKTVTVKFSESMDYATALNVANYKVSGQSIFTNAIFDGNDSTVTLTVLPGTITYSGDRLISVTGAKDKAGNVNTAYSDILNFNENVAPTVASAKLVDATHIAVTFSENVAATTAEDFEVYIGGVKVDAAKVSTSESAIPTNTATITLEDPITDLSKAIQVKLVNVKTADVNGNLAITGQFVTVQ
ncbi:N-acetylmuramoyl-L-alanine amidase family protein [Clostridium sp. JN-9]|uniref:N-acetylmuramoyl-L-alanine amidase family protein n=1 Tax=Clostridium sp. JN-9 TaxID=2507159 RepID=UPI000FFE04A5|nr:N-acetylmuramoyl-L-alanine amidase family protein [Clostridium sp. JN-9]QAT41031.1 N-acetylmuramoyl-L-alanine amidase family protein [Clostridium sp. JN-9]